MKTVVIFGGSGFIGQNIICRLAKKKYRILVPFQLYTNNEAKLRLFGDLGQILPLKFNHLNEKIIHNIIHEADVILNLKTIWHEKRSYSYKNNIFNFNKQLVNLINSIDNKKPFLFFSGLGVSKQSSSKRVQYIARAEQYIIQNLQYNTIIKPGIVIGEGDQFLRKLLLIFKLSFFIPLFGSGAEKLQPVFVDDVAKAIEIILEKDLKNKNIYELAGPEIFTYRSFYQFLAECLKVRRIFVRIPFSLALIMVSLIEKILFNLITKDQLLLLREDNIISNLHKNFGDLGIFPRDLRDIIKKIL